MVARLVIMAALVLFAGAVAAQEATPEVEALPAIRACTVDEAAELEEQIQAAASGVMASIVIADNFRDLAEDLARDQRAFSYLLPNWPDCADTYQRAYPLMVAISEVAIAAGLGVQAGSLSGDDQDDMVRDAQKHIREALRLLERKLPELEDLIEVLEG